MLGTSTSTIAILLFLANHALLLDYSASQPSVLEQVGYRAPHSSTLQQVGRQTLLSSSFPFIDQYRLPSSPFHPAHAQKLNTQHVLSPNWITNQAITPLASS